MAQEDSIVEEMEGTLVKFSVEGTGKSAKGVDWTRYKYTIQTRDGPRTCSGFVDQMKDKLLNQDVKITYTETPNAKYPDSPPFKNVKSMGLLVTEEHVQEANKQYNVVPLKAEATPTQAKLPAGPTADEQKMDALHYRKQDEILFGQCLNLAFQWITNERTIS